MSLYSAFSFIFQIVYSKNFDKYKIIESILSKRNEDLFNNNLKTKKTIELKDIKLNDINKEETLLEKNDNENQIDDNINILKENDIYNDYIDNISNKQKKEGRVLPKLRFIDFIINNLYFEKCYKCKKKEQQLISECNDILFKYYSIENILYNQFIL